MDTDPTPASADALPATDAPAPAPVFDAHGFDPAEFEWRPVPRRPRSDGWTPDVQRAFIEALADTGMVEHAARAVGLSAQGAYRLRRAPGSESFARAWDAAVASAAQRLVDIAFSRAIEGEETPVFDRDGCRIGVRWKGNDRLMMFLLRAYLPDRFRHAHADTRRPDEPALPNAVPVAKALEALAPVTPAQPQLSAPAERMEAMIVGARDRAMVDALYPPDTREPYRQRPVEEDAMAATARRHQRYARKRGEEEE